MIGNFRYKREGKCLRCGACCSTVENCENFKMSETGLATCLIYDGDRPLDCKLFPEAPPIMFKDCGFYFLDTWENNRVVKPLEI